MSQFFYLGDARVAVKVGRRWVEYLPGGQVGADVTDMVRAAEAARSRSYSRSR